MMEGVFYKKLGNSVRKEIAVELKKERKVVFFTEKLFQNWLFGVNKIT